MPMSLAGGQDGLVVHGYEDLSGDGAAVASQPAGASFDPVAELGSRRARLALRAFQALAVVGVLAYAAQAGFPICGAGAQDFFEIYVYNGLILAAAAFCLVRAAAVRAERARMARARRWDCCSWAAGEAYYSLFLANDADPPLPSVADGLWLAFYPACYIAIVLLVRERVREFRSSLWLDGLVGALAAVGDRRRAGLRRDSSRRAATRRPWRSTSPTCSATSLLLGFVVAVFALTGWRPGPRAGCCVGAGLVTSAVVDGYFLYEDATGARPRHDARGRALARGRAACSAFAAWLKPTAGAADPLRGLARAR